MNTFNQITEVANKFNEAIKTATEALNNFNKYTLPKPKSKFHK